MPDLEQDAPFFKLMNTADKPEVREKEGIEMTKKLIGRAFMGIQFNF